MPRTWFAPRFTIAHVAVLCLVCAGASLWVARWRAGAAEEAPHPDAQALSDKYGPERNSYGEEEWIVRDFFADKRNGFFLDVGANHYRKTSNTYYLETALGWSGIAVEPLREFEADYVAHRPRTKFRAFFVSDVSNELAKMYVNSQTTLISSGVRTFTERQGKASEIEVPTITLTDLLDAERVTAVDYLSMDIELWEPKALAGFDIARFKPQLVCIEAHPEVRQQILDYFAAHNYVLVGKYLRADLNNLYFKPRG